MIKFGLIGFGGIARSHKSAHVRLENEGFGSKLVAICDIRSEIFGQNMEINLGAANVGSMDGINLDTGNLILYGKANPVDALDMIGTKVYDVHLKDGLYPTDGKHLGKEVRFGDGKANFKEFLPKLKALGYEGSLTIEREITGEKQIADIIYARDLIKKYWK